MSLVDVPKEYDCLKEGHLDAVSMCCGSGEHSDIEGMCIGCNEFTGWVCSVSKCVDARNSVPSWLLAAESPDLVLPPIATIPLVWGPGGETNGVGKPGSHVVSPSMLVGSPK